MITLVELKAYLNIESGETAYDTALNQMISAVTKHIENKCNRVIISAPVVEVRKGDDKDYIYLNNPKVTAITSIKKYNTSTDAFEAYLTGTGVRLPSSEFSSKIILKAGEIFDSSIEYEITYTSGYAVADVPADLKQASYYLCQDFWNKTNYKGNNANRLGLQSLSDVTISNLVTSFKEINIDSLIQPYIMYNV